MADEKRNRRRGLLKQYYGVQDVDPKEGFDPYNINAPEFNSDLFLHKVNIFILCLICGKIKL